MPKFQVVSDYTPSGDQPEAIASLAQGVEQFRQVRKLGYPYAV